MFLNNIKCYDVGEHEITVEGKRDKVEFSPCFLSVLHIIEFYIIVLILVSNTVLLLLEKKTSLPS